jgi:hypothetical protein
MLSLIMIVTALVGACAPSATLCTAGQPPDSLANPIIDPAPLEMQTVSDIVVCLRSMLWKTATPLGLEHVL